MDPNLSQEQIETRKEIRRAQNREARNRYHRRHKCAENTKSKIYYARNKERLKEKKVLNKEIDTIISNSQSNPIDIAANVANSISGSNLVDNYKLSGENEEYKKLSWTTFLDRRADDLERIDKMKHKKKK